MTAQLIIEKTSVTEQQFILPGRHTWQQFKAIQSVMENGPGLKISYVDGVIEFMTTGEAHEMFKKAIAIGSTSPLKGTKKRKALRGTKQSRLRQEAKGKRQ